ncbi:MAG TPA: 50S ribosomal protein L10 [Candidatus Saccharimonadales bacterium]|jgi:large subunit ribosomal protein L10|nr:50S ribosomal protein L10 [Candidatus Saccharimonadales bacterium]
MAINRQTKESQVAELAALIGDAKLTTFAAYQGLTVKELQSLRRAAREAGVTIKVVKNRLVRVALSQNEQLKDVDTGLLKGQLLYAMSSVDEVAPAQVLAKFAKEHEALKLIGGFDAVGTLLEEADVKALASLPTKDQLRGILVGTIAAPLSGFVNVLAGNVRGVLNVLNARADALEN